MIIYQYILSKNIIKAIFLKYLFYDLLLISMIIFQSQRLQILQQYNNMKNSYAEPDQPYQHMLHQLRNLLTSDMHITPQQLDTTDSKINKYLKQSYTLIQQNNYLINNPDPYMLHSKISQASQLLKQQNSMIKNYVKDKIQANLNTSRQIRPNQQNYQKLLQIRTELEKKRLEEKIAEDRRVNQMIQATRKFRKYQSKSQIPLIPLESLLHKQGIDYDKILKQQHKIKSTNNKIVQKQKIVLNIQPKSNIRKHKSPKIQKIKDIQNYTIQVQGIQQNQKTFYKSKLQNQQTKILHILNKNSKFTKVFIAFLRQQIQKYQSNLTISQQKIQNKSLQNTQMKKKRYKFPRKLQNFSSQPNTQLKISELSKMYKFRSFIINKQEQIDQKIKNIPIKKIVSKRNGTTNKYHMKQCLLENRVMYYTDQQDDGNLKKSDMKSIQISIAPLDTVQLTKQEGSLFQKKQEMIQAVILKGPEKDFVFQLRLAEGVQLRQEIIKINLRRLHRINGLIGRLNNKNMQKFIQEQHTTLDFSQSYIRNQQQYPQKSYRSIFINMIVSTFPNRKSTNILNFSQCRLSINQLNLIIRQCDKHFTNITSLNFSHTKLDKQNLKNILNLIKKCPPSNKVSLNLTNCGIDDDVIQANVTQLTAFSSKIETLQLAQNQISIKSINHLRNILSSKICEIKTLNLSKCPIQHFGQIFTLIKNAIKLQNLNVSSCKLNLNNHKIFEDLLVLTQQRQELKSINLTKNVFTGSIRWFQEISPYLQISVDLPNKNMANSQKKIPLQSKYLRVAFQKK